VIPEAPRVLTHRRRSIAIPPASPAPLAFTWGPFAGLATGVLGGALLGIVAAAWRPLLARFRNIPGPNATHFALLGTVGVPLDPDYPGTAVERMLTARVRARSLAPADLSGDWAEVRRRLLWAAGLRDLPEAPVGGGNTSHSFNDYNHCDATCMLPESVYRENAGEVPGIALGNRLGAGIEAASLPELGPGGSWSTCTNGCHLDPPRDVAHVQFRARIAFKLVWCPPTFTTFVLVDDDGVELNRGTPNGDLPPLEERRANFALVRGSKYATAALK
jgi:hypothetical protein